MHTVTSNRILLVVLLPSCTLVSCVAEQRIATPTTFPTVVSTDTPRPLPTIVYDNDAFHLWSQKDSLVTVHSRFGCWLCTGGRCLCLASGMVSRGDLLTSTSWDGTVILWGVDTP